MLGAGLIVGGVAVALLVISLDRRIRDAFQGRSNSLADDEEQESTTGYTSLAPLLRRNRRRVRFASNTVKYPPPPAPAPWRSKFYEPTRQRFETIIVDGVFIRHSFSSSGHSIA